MARAHFKNRAAEKRRTKKIAKHAKVLKVVTTYYLERNIPYKNMAAQIKVIMIVSDRISVA